MPSLPQDEEREIAEGSREDQSEYVLPTELPLLDAVQTLVDKERQLMELKVAEAAHEANGNNCYRKMHTSLGNVIAASCVSSIERVLAR